MTILANRLGFLPARFCIHGRETRPGMACLAARFARVRLQARLYGSARASAQPEDWSVERAGTRWGHSTVNMSGPAATVLC